MTGFGFTESVGFTSPVDQPVLLKSRDALTFQDFYSSGAIDLRAYQSYALMLRLENGTLLTTDVVDLDLFFYMDSTLSSNAEVFDDSYTIYKTDILGSSRVQISDICHGSFMELSLTDPFVTGRTGQLTYRIYGSYRPIANTFLRTSPNGMIYGQRRILAAGANDGGQAARLAYGRGRAVLVSGAGGGATMDIAYGGSTVTDDVLVAGAANTRVTQEIILPRIQARVTITNTGAAGSTIDAFIVYERNPF